MYPPPPPPPQEKTPEKPLENPEELLVELRGAAADRKLESEELKALAKIMLLKVVIPLPSYQSGGLMLIPSNLFAQIFSTPKTIA